MSDIHGVKDLLHLFLDSDGISTDTRSIQAGQLYFALRGESFDGNRFAHLALEKGASAAVVSDVSLTGDRFIHVDDTLVALQELASVYRETLKMPVIGITGSNGKTTTKELIAAVLGAKYRLSFTKGNLNNHIGVPLTLLSIPQDADLAIVEMGANHIGEIAMLCSLARPTHGLVTNVGMAHIEGFGSVEGIRKGKSELYDWLSAHNGIAFVNVDEEYLADLSSAVESRVFYGTGEAEFCYSVVRSTPDIVMRGPETSAGRVELHSSLFGIYNARNIMTAATLGLYFDVPGPDISTAVDTYRSDNNRSQVVQQNGITIIMDAYNANPTSMTHALNHFVMRGGRKAAILGGMNELGPVAASEHQRLADLAGSLAIEVLIFVGSHYEETTLPAGAHYFKDVDALSNYLAEHHLNAENVLVKGSRSLRLESAMSHIH